MNNYIPLRRDVALERLTFACRDIWPYISHNPQIGTSFRSNPQILKLKNPCHLCEISKKTHFFHFVTIFPFFLTKCKLTVCSRQAISKQSVTNNRQMTFWHLNTPFACILSKPILKQYHSFNFPYSIFYRSLCKSTKSSWHSQENSVSLHRKINFTHSNAQPTQPDNLLTCQLINHKYLWNLILLSSPELA